jgi:hypothetical protein
MEQKIMSTFQKVNRLSLVFLVCLAFALLSGCCGFGLICDDEHDEQCEYVTCFTNTCKPGYDCHDGRTVADVSEGTPGTVTVSITGQNLSNPIAMQTDGDGLTVSSWTFSNGAIQVTLAVADNGPALGAHTITSIFGSNGNPSNIDSTILYVTCPGCVPRPRLSSPTFPDGSKTIARGETKTVRFHGRELLNNSPVVEFHPDETGLSLPPNTTINVQHQGTTDYFDVPLVAAPNAPYGLHQMRVVTAGGRTVWRNVMVVGATSSQIPPPANVPTLSYVSPSHISPGGDVFIECHGKGFGVNRTVLTSPAIPTTTLPLVNAEEDPDSVVVAKIHPADAGRIKITVDNLDDSAAPSDEIRIFVDPLVTNAPLAWNNASDGVHRGGTYTLHVTGENLSEITDVSWHGSPGLTFSNTSATDATATVTVSASSTAILSGNQATNVFLTNGNYTSLPFSLNVLP